MNNSYVVIVGGGPAGSYCAKELAKKEIDVVVLEKDNFCGEKNVCGGVLNSNAIEKHGLQYATQGELSKARIYYENDYLEFDQKRYAFLRSFFDKKISEEAIKNGAKFLHNHLMVDYSINSKNIKIKVKDLNTGKDTTITSEIIVGADGFASRVRNKINSKKFTKNDYGIAVQYQIPYSAFNKIDIDLDIAYFILSKLFKFGYAWIFPKEDRLTVGLACRIKDLTFDIRKALLNIFKYPIMKKQKFDYKKIIYESSLIPDRIPGNIIDDRVILIGDAAGFVKPISGGGIEYAIESAIEAANVISKIKNEKINPDKANLREYVEKVEWIKNKIEKEKKIMQTLEKFDFNRLQKIMIKKHLPKTLEFLFTGEKKILLEVFKELPILSYHYFTNH